MEIDPQAFDGNPSEEGELRDEGTEVAPNEAEAANVDPDVAEAEPDDDDGELVLIDGELVLMDPAELVIGDNARTEVELEKGFVADIKARGVRAPILAHRDADGKVVVHVGQQRALGAVQAKLKRVRVLIEREPGAGDGEKKRQIARIVDQANENNLRGGFSERDDLRITQDLLGLGLTAGQVAYRLKRPRRRIDAEAAVARSSAASSTLFDGEGNLFQSAVVAEFDGDETAQQKLKAVLKEDPEQFDHTVQQLRDARTEREMLAAAAAELGTQGVRVIEELSGEGEELRMLRLSPSAEYGSELTVEEHRECPGHAAVLSSRRYQTWQRSSGPEVITTFVCTDWRGNGHARKYAPKGEVEVASSARQTQGGAITDEGRAEQSAERRRVRENNSNWASAQEERIRWVKEVLLQRGKAPADPEKWFASVLLFGDHYARRATSSIHVLTCHLLGLESDELSSAANKRRILEATTKATSARAKLVNIAILIAGFEELIPRDGWRHDNPPVRAYLAQLQAWGYTLSQIERSYAFPEQAEAAADTEDVAADDVAAADDAAAAADDAAAAADDAAAPDDAASGSDSEATNNE